jgi:plastocyanin
MKKFLVLSLLLFVVPAACGGGGGGGGAGPDEVQMVDGQRFDPQDLAVSVGDSVTFVNGSSETHTVTAYEDELPEGAEYFASGGFTSEKDARSNLSEGLIDPGETYQVTFDKPGTYGYFCLPHEASGMIGSIEVKP